jgi:hypothetical protein
MKRHHVISLATLTLILTLAGVLFLVHRAPAQLQTRQTICPGAIAAGWIKVDAVASEACGGSDAWVLEPTSNKIPGSAMYVCADQPTPPGWETLGVATSTGQCAGSGTFQDNIKSIRRLG